MATTDKIPNIFLSFLLLSMIIGCNKKHIDSQKWYDDTKAEILKQANLKADSISDFYDKDSSRKCQYSYLKGHLFRECTIKKEGTHGGIDFYFSKDGKFVLRREICNNDTILFEGIYYQGGFYGLSTWWKNCDKRQIRSQGLRYKSSEIGIWQL